MNILEIKYVNKEWPIALPIENDQEALEAYGVINTAIIDREHYAEITIDNCKATFRIRYIQAISLIPSIVITAREEKEKELYNARMAQCQNANQGMAINTSDTPYGLGRKNIL